MQNIFLCYECSALQYKQMIPEVKKMLASNEVFKTGISHDRSDYLVVVRSAVFLARKFIAFTHE